MPKQDTASYDISAIAARKRKRGLVILLLLTALMLLFSVVSLSMGSMRIPIGSVIGVLLGKSDPTNSLVILQLRLPRIVAAILIGAALAVSGAVLQGIIRNPLAAPDLIGVTGGASVAAVAFITLSAGKLSIHWLPLVAIAGAFLTAGMNYVLAWKKGVSPLRLVLIGIGIATAMGALTTFLLISGPAYLASQVLNWMTGSIYGTAWKHVAALTPWIAVFIPMAVYFSKELNVQSLGESLAIGLGSRIQRTRLMLLFISVALAGAAVGIAGTISFIGLLAPHMARRIVGPSYGILLPVSALLGALILLAADLAGRMLFQPLDVPAGVFTAGIGAPFFLYLLFKRRS